MEQNEQNEISQQTLHASRITVVMGTRPEAIRLCPLVGELRRRKKFDVRVLSTGQHRLTLDGTLRAFGIKADRDLDVARAGQTLAALTSRIVRETDTALASENTDLVIVEGDSATAFGASLAAFYRRIPVAHVDAGLRSHHRTAPFPEEFHRTALAGLAEYHFAPTVTAKKNLLREGISDDRVVISGCTVTDALRFSLTEGKPTVEWDFPSDARVILFTAHRRESSGAPVDGMFRALLRVVNTFPDVVAVCPLHRNPEVQRVAGEIFKDVPRVRMVDPPEIVSFHRLLARADLVLTDSGSIREEAAALGIPTVVTKYSTELTDGIRSGVLRLAGSGEDGIFEVASRLLAKDSEEYRAMKKPSAVSGDASAAARIADVIEKIL